MKSGLALLPFHFLFIPDYLAQGFLVFHLGLESGNIWSGFFTPLFVHDSTKIFKIILDVLTLEFSYHTIPPVPKVSCT